jgi:hypothetical protein
MCRSGPDKRVAAHSPAVISLPCKLLLFVMVDGWALVCGASCRGSAEPAHSVRLLISHATKLRIGMVKRSNTSQASRIQ